MYDKENNIELRKTEVVDGLPSRETVWHGKPEDMDKVARRLYFNVDMIKDLQGHTDITITSYSVLVHKKLIKTKHIVTEKGITIGEYYNMKGANKVY